MLTLRANSVLVMACCVSLGHTGSQFAGRLQWGNYGALILIFRALHRWIAKVEVRCGTGRLFGSWLLESSTGWCAVDARLHGHGRG